MALPRHVGHQEKLHDPWSRQPHVSTLVHLRYECPAVCVLGCKVCWGAQRLVALLLQVSRHTLLKPPQLRLQASDSCVHESTKSIPRVHPELGMIHLQLCSVQLVKMSGCIFYLAD